MGRYEQEVGNMFDFTREKTISSVEQSLERLGVEYIDLIQVENQKLCSTDLSFYRFMMLSFVTVSVRLLTSHCPHCWS